MKHPHQLVPQCNDRLCPLSSWLMRPVLSSIVRGWVLFFACFAGELPLLADDFHEGFESETATSQVTFDGRRVQLKTHERNQALAFSGQAAERFQFVTQEYDVPIEIECEVKPARVLDELTLSISVFCNRPGTQIAARVVFPHQKDPQTGQPVTRLLNGGTLEKANSWQKLQCRPTDDTIARHLILWRAALQPQELDPREMYIDRIYLRQTLGRGMTEILIDDLRMSPIVSPNWDHFSPLPRQMTQGRAPKIAFQLDRLEVNGSPLFPRIVPYQREPLELFSQLGANVVWVDNYLNRDLIDQLNAQNIWATAWPPSAKSDQGEILDAVQANMVPFGPETNGILFWNLGVRIDPTTHKQLKHWVHQVKASDRGQNRPILADVTGEETIFSRDVDMLGISKHILQTPYSFREFMEHVQRRMLLAQPGTFMMTWLQTEPSRAVTQYREAFNLTPAVVEPEQIRLQTYAALCAGCKGIGYWNWTPLNATGTGYEERRLVLEQLMQELELLEPFVAGGEVIHRFDVPLTPPQEGAAKSPAAGSEPPKSPHTPPPPLEITAAVVKSEHGLIVLLTALEENAQYVPGQIARNDLRVLVRGLPESADLREITSTGLWPLETRRVAGGTEIRLPRFNMTAALMVATDQGVVEEMSRKIRRVQARSAELSLQLAEAKFERVQKVDQQLMSLGVGLPEGIPVLEQARKTLDESRLNYQKQQYHQARTNAELACQLLRILQKLYWQQAVRHVSSPTSIPHTLCFQTLPDYWELIQALAKTESQPNNVLRSGQFEDPDAMLVEGWTKDVTPSKEIVVYDALDPQTAHEGDYCLRMAAVPAEGKTHVNCQEPSVSYRSPAIRVKPGDLLHVSGWVRIPRPLTGSLEGFRIYDTHYGAASCLHWSDPSEWKQFEMMRPIWKQEDVRVIMELNGLGDVAVDDLQVKIVRLRQSELIQQVSLPDQDNREETPKSRANAFDFLNRFIK